MAQYRDGTVTVTNGSQSVFGVFRARVTALTGVFSAGASITFSGGATAVVEAWDALAYELRFRVTGSVMPELPETIAQTTPSPAAATLAEWHFRPDFIAQTANGAMFTRADSNVPYVVADRPNRGKLTLASAYAGVSENQVAYAVSQDFEPSKGYPVPAQRDAQTALIVAESIRRIGADMKGEAWRTIGAAGQPAFDSDWGSVGGIYAPAAFYLTGDGHVLLRGAVFKGTAGSPPVQIFLLPTGYRPVAALTFPCVTNTGFGQILVLSGGNVFLQSGGTGFVSFDGILFRAGV